MVRQAQLPLLQSTHDLPTESSLRTRATQVLRPHLQ